MKKKQIEYQSVKVQFPTKLYLAANWFQNDLGKLTIYTHHKMYTDPKVAIKSAKQIRSSLMKINHTVLKHMLILPLTFMEKLPLKKEYWENPVFTYTEKTRAGEITKIFLKNSGYKLLITPGNAKKKVLLAAIPFLQSASITDVETFMYTSDWNVDPLADACAFYLPEETLSINILTGKIFRKDKPKSKNTNLKN